MDSRTPGALTVTTRPSSATTMPAAAPPAVPVPRTMVPVATSIFTGGWPPAGAVPRESETVVSVTVISPSLPLVNEKPPFSSIPLTAKVRSLAPTDR